MSTQCIIVAFLLSFCQKLSKLVEIWRSFDKNKFAWFLRHGVIWLNTKWLTDGLQKGYYAGLHLTVHIHGMWSLLNWLSPTLCICHMSFLWSWSSVFNCKFSACGISSGNISTKLGYWLGLKFSVENIALGSLWNSTVCRNLWSLYSAVIYQIISTTITSGSNI